MSVKSKIFLFSLFLAPNFVSAEESYQTRYPTWLQNSYFDINIGYIDFPFSQLQLEPGYRVESVGVPHPAVRIGIFGRNFNETFSAQITYMRPVEWVKYKNINGVPATRTVWMNLAGATLRASKPFGNDFSGFIEGGMGIVTRHGFGDEGHNMVKDANYATLFLGAGLKYKLNETWDLQTSLAYLPPNLEARQPHTLMLSGGAVVNMRPRKVDQTNVYTDSNVIFPKNLIQAGHATNELGTDINHFLAAGKVPIFWGGHVEVTRGLFVRYQRNTFHTENLFSLDLGISVGNWWSNRAGQNFWTFSAYPFFRFTPLRFKESDFYLFYSVAGPTYITKAFLDGYNTGKHFTFQDMMGAGFYFGKNRDRNFEIGIGHYSNGNLFTRNAGVKIPLTFSMGFTF